MSYNSGSKCKSCGAPIKWIKTESGKSIPINTDMVTILQDTKGDVIIVTLSGIVVKGRLTMSGTPGAEQGYTSHFSRCPQSDQWRRG